MRKANWKAISELTGIAAIVGSLLFVGLQMRLDQDIAKAMVWSESESNLRELAQFVDEHRDI